MKANEPNSNFDQLLAAIRKHSEMDDDQIVEAGNHGADAGWPGFIYTTDCAEFYRNNERAIWNLLEDTAESLGVKPLELIASFRRSDMASSQDGFANLLAWFALEEVGRWLAEENER